MAGETTLERLLAAAWPEGPPAAELEFASMLTEAKRRIAGRRLAAMLAVESLRSPDIPQVARIASEAGVSAPTLYVLRRRWASSRSLRSLVPHAAARDTKAYNRTRDEIRNAARKALARALKRDPGASQAKIVASAMLMLGDDAPSKATMIRLLVELGATTVAVRGDDALYLDVVAMDRAFEVARRGRGSSRPELWRFQACLLVDGLTTQVLAAAAALPGDVSSVQGLILGDFWHEATGSRVEADPEPPSTAMVFIQDDASAGLPSSLFWRDSFDGLAMLRRLSAEVEVRSTGGFRFGRVVARMGGELGGLRLLPRRSGVARSRLAEAEGVEAVTVERAQSLLDVAVALHNRGLSKLNAGGARFAARREELRHAVSWYVLVNAPVSDDNGSPVDPAV